LRRLLKFLHTLGGSLMIGAMGALLVLLSLTPPPRSPAGYAFMLDAMGAIATWVLLPSVAVTLISGLLAIAVNPIFHDAGWAWAKAASGLAIFEGGLVSLIGPLQAGAKMSAAVLAGQADPLVVARAFGPERNTLWLLMAIAIANVVVGVWRPRFSRRPPDRPPVGEDD
jgi:hypothetical protein